MERLRLPRASSAAFRQLKLNQGSGEDVVPPDTAAIPEAPALAQGTPSGLNAHRVLQALHEIKRADAASLLDRLPPATNGAAKTLSQLIDAVQAGQVAAADVPQVLRALLERLISSLWVARDREAAQAASELLDMANDLLDSNNADDADAHESLPPSMPASGSDVPAMPPEDFFLPLATVRDILTVNIDSSILLRQQHASLLQQPTRRKRKVDGNAQAGQGRRKTGDHYNPWTSELQQQLASVLFLSLGGSVPKAKDLATLPTALAVLVSHLRGSQAGEQLQAMGATLAHAISVLQLGGFTDFEELLNDIREECLAAMEAYLTLQTVDVRRGRLVAHIESFINTLGTAIEALLSQMRMDRKVAREAAGEHDEEGEEEQLDGEFYPTSLPPCILANKEPFKGGEWQKMPFIPRPYVRLTEYDIVEPSMRDIIQRKLSTKKHGGCSGKHCKSRHELGLYNVEQEGFVTQCSCLARNTECDERCACHSSGQCLNRAVTERRALQLAVDAEEVDSWGMDCYVRRNILDAVLESGAFGPWAPPDYKALTAADPVQYAALRAAATKNGTAAASPAAAALPPPAIAGKEVFVTKEEHLQVAGLSDTPTTPARASSSGADVEQDGEVVAARPPALASPPPTPAQVAVEKRVADWLERVLVPAINKQGARGWDLLAALQHVKQGASESQDDESLKAAEAVEQRLNDVGYNYFRLHPKGVGLVCKHSGGLPPLTFIEEYLGEIHTPWRWFELQDAVKKITGDELPDFYNIVLERPKDDPDGYDVLFIDAAAKGALASRMSHSCTPNCQAIVMACGGRLTIALYTLRHVHEGEELTFDYSSVTESEKEFREAICLCSSRNCRGSYLYFTGSRAFQQVMNTKHTFLHRQVMIARAGCEPVTEADWDRIKRHGLGDSALGSVEHGDRAPDWLVKWTSLISEFIEEEEAHLKEDLLSHPLGIYNEATATAEAKGVVNNRLQNVVITLDKVKMVLQAPGQSQRPCLQVLTDDECVEHLWSGTKSVARRILMGCIDCFAAEHIGGSFTAAWDSNEEFLAAVQLHASELPGHLVDMCNLVMEPAFNFSDARHRLLQLYKLLRSIDLQVDGGLTAVADLCLLYACTLHWFTSERGYKSITSPPVPINLADISLNRTQGQPGAAGALAAAPNAARQHSVQAGSTEHSLASSSKPESLQDLSAAMAGSESEGQAVANQSNLRKVYRPLYIWGQLSGWFKQTVNDPTASLSAERRGTVSLPDVESSFGGGKARYTAKDRCDLVEQLDKRPDAMWRTGTIWSFRNEAKVYGSPMMDAAWHELSRGAGGDNPMPSVLAELRSATVPPRMQLTAAASGRGGRRK